MSTQSNTTFAPIPLQWVGPLFLHFDGQEIRSKVPLATFESPLWPSVERGAKLCEQSGGIHVTVAHECMTRSILLEAESGAQAILIANKLAKSKNEIAEVVQSTSRHAQFQEIHTHVIGPLLYVRLSISSGDASGHNMATKAAEYLIDWVLKQYPELRYVSISGNFCTDKKASSVNSILGRGKYTIAEVTIPRKLCTRYLKATPEAIINLNLKKNLLGSIAAGSLHTANAHFANMLLAFYLATGQDAANIIEGSQGITFAQMKGDDLYFSVTLPNIIVGTVGNGKDLPFVKENLTQMNCSTGRMLAAYIGGTVLCGELSLLAAQTNRGELVQTHMSLERAKTV